MLVFRGFAASANSPIVLAIGNFDGVHIGHQAIFKRLIQTARSLGLPSSVLTFEPHPREFLTPEQAPARLTTLREKLDLFKQGGIDQVRVCRFNNDFANMPAHEFISKIAHQGLQARKILVGEDFRFGLSRSGSVKMLQEMQHIYHYQVEVMKDWLIEDKRVSSTLVRQQLAAGNLKIVNTLLDRPYSMSGRVVKGDQIGRQLGFPTANIQLKRNRSPLWGIYAVKMHGIAAHPLPGVASLGTRPTLVNNGMQTLEVHLFDFDEDIYARRVKVEFIEKLRDEKKYPGVDALRAQILMDVKQAKMRLDVS